MGIFDALSTAVTGLQAQSFALQNISGNIANSGTTAFKRTETRFEDLVNNNVPQLQIAGEVQASSASTNNVQGSIQSSSIGTFMAINGQGYFVVQKPSSFSSSGPVFNNANLYTRRGDFQPDKNGFMVNGAGNFLMGIPLDPTSGNPVGSVPQILQFNNNFLPAQATTAIQYNANLASSPLPPSAKTGVLGSELLNPANFEANPVAGAPPQAKITSIGAVLAPDAAAVTTGTQDISALPAGGVTGTLVINGTNINLLAADTAAGIVIKINAQSGVTNVSAALNVANHLVLTSANATTNTVIGGASTGPLLTELGLSTGTTNATNLVNQGAVAVGQTLKITIGANPPLVITFGPGGPPANAQTLAELSTALASLNPAIGTASVNIANGNITIGATSATDQIAVGGTAAVANFGIHNLLALPANATVIANDVSTFINESRSGGSITGFDASGAPVNVQFRWAKVDGKAEGGTDTWNMFYQSNSNATGIQSAWQNIGTNFTFAANGQMSPAINNLIIPNLTVNGVSLGNIQLNFGTGGLTQFADVNGNVQVNSLSQDGSTAGTLQTISVSAQGRVDGAFSNGRTVDLANITLANFTGENFLQKADGGAFSQTGESGIPLFNASGRVVGGSLEASNTDIADQFTKLIVTQQAYSANTKIITVSNQMVQAMLSTIP